MSQSILSRFMPRSGSKSSGKGDGVPSMQPGMHKSSTPNSSSNGVAQSTLVKRTFSGLNEIKEELIDQIVDLSHGHPVFRVIFFQGLYEMVVKAEEQGKGETIKQSAGRFNATASTMRVIGNAAISEVLSKKEMAALNKAVKHNKGTEELKKQLARPAFWVKMKYKNQLTDLQKPDFDGITDKQRAVVATVMPKLQGNKRAWNSLGEVMAGDFFIGNQDRVAFSASYVNPHSKSGKVTPATSSLVNPGNIFFKFDSNGNIKKALALDNFDANQTETANLHGTDISEWIRQCAPVLVNQAQRLEFATGIVARMITHAADMGTDIDFYMLEETDLAVGIEQGIAKLKTRLVAEANHKDNKKSIPPGILARMKYLGWV